MVSAPAGRTPPAHGSGRTPWKKLEETLPKPRTIPTTLTVDNYPVVAWIPVLHNADEAIAVLYRTEAECADRPYAVGTARPRDAGSWRFSDGEYDIEGIGDAVQAAISRAERVTRNAAPRN